MIAEERIERQLEAEIVAPAGQRRVGVLFVHGVGSQPESSTVREFGEPLRRWLAAWHRNEKTAGFRVLWSRLSYGEDPDGPARFAMRIPRHGGRAEQTWIVAEAWWAARLEAPSLLTMVTWSSSILLRMLGRLADQTARVIERSDGAWRRSVAETVIARLHALVLLLGYAAAAIVGYPLLWVLFLLAQLPFQPVEQFILVRLLRPFLVDKIGDFYVYLYDDAEALHVRRTVFEAIRWLVDEERCDHVVVVGHSQGAVVAYDALASPEAAALDRVPLLVTVGGALNNAWDFAPPGFDRLACSLPPRIRWVNVWSTYDPVSHGPLVHRCPRPPQEYVVTNRMNVVTDHGGYVENPEEFVSYLAQLIDGPADHTRSRFWAGWDVRRAWVQRRRDRVIALVAWRLAAMYAFSVAVTARGAQLIDDGNALWSWVEKAPALGGIVQAAERLADAGRSLLVPPYGPASALLLGTVLYLAVITLAFGGRGRAGRLLPPAAALVIAALFLRFPIIFGLAVGTAFWGLAASAAYLVVTRIVFDRWHEEEGNASARRTAPAGGQRARIAARTAAVLVGIAAIALAVARLGPLPTPAGS